MSWGGALGGVVARCLAITLPAKLSSVLQGNILTCFLTSGQAGGDAARTLRKAGHMLEPFAGEHEAFFLTLERRYHIVIALSAINYY